MTNLADDHPRRDGGSVVGDNMSFWLSLITTIGLIVWVAVTHYRGDVPIPSYWLTAAAPVWAALVVLGLQMAFLVASAINATKREEMGMTDMIMSIATFIVTVILTVLLVVGTVRYGANLVNGMAAFMWTNGVEMICTIGVWMVANRRPGGVIGGGP